jgi:uncharacterized phiE125 gp8 family phage protein
MAYSIEKTSSVTASDIITTADLKGHLRVDHSDEDTLIEALRGAAIEYCENYCNISLGDVTAVMYLDRFFATWEIPVGPVVSIESITWNISADTTETLDTGNYYVDVKRSPARVSIINAPQVYDYVHNGVQVNFTYGYPEASIPTAIKHAIRLLVGHWYENRRQVIQANSYEVPMGVHALLNTYRIER